MSARKPGSLLRPVLAALLLATVFSTTAAAYTGCNKYRFGSQDWWFCMSDKDGER